MDIKDENKSKGLNIPLASDTSEEYNPTKRRNLDFNKIKVGLKTLEDAVLTSSGDLKKANPRLADKQNVIKAIDTYDYALMREISDIIFIMHIFYN